MSATISVPKGIDSMSADDTKLLDAMRAEEAPPPGSDAPEPTQRRAPEPQAADAADVADIDDDAGDVGDTAADAPDATGKTKLVPHAQFHAANERRKVAEKKAAEAELRLATETAKVQTRLDMLQAAMTASAMPAPAAAVEIELPDVETDPVGHFKAVAAQEKAARLELTAAVRSIQERDQQQRQLGELRNWGAAQERAFQAAEPSYDEAMQFLTQNRHAELEAIGVTDPMQRAQIIGSDVQQIALRARQEGANFAERLFKTAEARGFKKIAPASTGTTIGGVVVPPMEATIDAPAAVTRVNNGRENSTTIGSLGAAPPTRLSVEKIANMGEAEFEALVSKMTKGERINLLGY